MPNFLIRIAVSALPAIAFSSAEAALIFTESWESPAVSAGNSSSALPTGWVEFSGPSSSSLVIHPTTGAFNTTSPLAAPAAGNQALSLAGSNTGVYRMSGATISADTTYTLSAAIGNRLSSPNDEFWSLQIWADSNGNHSFDAGDTFIGQQFGTSPSAVNPAQGDWAVNAFQFESASVPALLGDELIVFLNNFDSGTSYYDNVSLINSAVPEPTRASLVALSSILMALSLTRRRGSRRRSCA